MIIETLCMLSLSLASSQAKPSPLPPEVSKYQKTIVNTSDDEAVKRFSELIKNNSKHLFPLAQAYSKVFAPKVVKTVKLLTSQFPDKKVEITKAFALANPDDIEEIICACIQASPDALTILTLINTVSEITDNDTMLSIIDCAGENNPEIPHAQLLRAAQQNTPASQIKTTPSIQTIISPNNSGSNSNSSSGSNGITGNNFASDDGT